MSRQWIGIDWGTTHLRAWLFDDAGQPRESFSSDKGAGGLSGPEFEEALLALIGDHLPAQGQTDVFCCGMAGSKQGWVEAPYRATPSSLLPDNAEMLVFEAGSGRLRVHIAPGVSQADPPDVMRGEETQVAGNFFSGDRGEMALCLPGTHSKWALAGPEGISGFKTFPTGELFALLSQRSILRHSMAEGPTGRRAFAKGVEDAAENPARFLSELFPIRAADLLHGVSGPASRDRLSGLLIGLELANARSFWGDTGVTIIGAGALCDLYQTALATIGVDAMQADGGDMVRAGLVATRQHFRSNAE